MLSTIQGRMMAVFAAFLVLLGGVGLVTRSVLEQQTDDGVLVNLAGRQRMLVQKMTKESLQVVNATQLNQAGRATEARDKLRATDKLFDTTMNALHDGGAAPINIEMTKLRQLPPPSNPEIRKALDAAQEKWLEFKKHVQALEASETPRDQDIEAIVQANMGLVGALNVAVEAMQVDSESKVSKLLIIQGAAFLLGVLLVGVGAWIAASTIANPINQLAQAAHAMSTGNLNVQFNGGGTREVRELTESFDRMRASMMVALEGTGGQGDDL